MHEQMDRVKKEKHRSISGEKKKTESPVKAVRILREGHPTGFPPHKPPPKPTFHVCFCFLLLSFVFFIVKTIIHQQLKQTFKKKENCLFYKAFSGLLSTFISLNHLLSLGNIYHFMLRVTAVHLCGLPRLSAP